MSKAKAIKQTKPMALFQTEIQNYFVAFLEANKPTGKAKTINLEKLQELWQSEENQTKLTDVINTNMPEIKPLKPRKSKDPNAIKRPKSAYMYFSQEKRAQVKEENPDIKFTEVAKKLSELWKETEDKSEWEKQATEDKERYTKEKLEREPASGDKKPKRPKSAYIFFSQEMRPIVKKDNPDFDFSDITREISRIWNEEYKNDPEKNEKWTDLASAEKELYDEAKKQWDEEHPDEVKVPKSKKGKSAKKILEKTDPSDEDVKESPRKPETKVKAKEPAKESPRKPKMCLIVEMGDNGFDDSRDQLSDHLETLGFKNEDSSGTRALFANGDFSKFKKAVEAWSIANKVPFAQVLHCENPGLGIELPGDETDEPIKPTIPKATKSELEDDKKSSSSDNIIVATGMVLFVRENREKLEKANPDWNAEKITNELHTRWRKLTAKEKAKYNK